MRTEAWVGDYMTDKNAIEHYVRRKNSVYRKWRSEHSFKELDNICAEMVIAFGALPRWMEYVAARRSRDILTCAAIEKEHSAWKAEVREWALKRGVTRFEKQSAQLLKFYFAWWRFRYEQRNGKIARFYGRQMG